jgi:hypothetical protein
MYCFKKQTFILEILVFTVYYKYDRQPIKRKQTVIYDNDNNRQNKIFNRWQKLL